MNCCQSAASLLDKVSSAGRLGASPLLMLLPLFSLQAITVQCH